MLEEKWYAHSMSEELQLPVSPITSELGINGGKNETPILPIKQKRTPHFTSKFTQIFSFFSLLVIVIITLFATQLPTKIISKAADIKTATFKTECTALIPYKNKNDDAYSALQACIDNASMNSTVELPAGKYTIEKQIRITKPITLKTKGKINTTSHCTLEDSSCAEIIAGKNLSEPWGVMYVETDNFSLDHIIINGNNKIRWDGPAGKHAAEGNTVYGHNLMVMSCSNCHFTNNVLKNGLAATAFGYNYISPKEGYVSVNNHDTEIRNNLIAYNGVHNRSMLWSDGFSFSEGSHFIIKDNEFIDNTDIDFIMGGCSDCTITGNSIKHSGSAEGGSFAAMNFQAWVQFGNQTSTGDFSNTIISGNTIDCSAKYRCGFGLYLGSKAWGYTANKQLKGGTFTNNIIRNAQQGFLADTYTDAIVKNNQIINSGGYHKTSLGFRQMNACTIFGGAKIQFINNNITTCTSDRWDNPFELANSWFSNPNAFDSVDATMFIKYAYFYILNRAVKPEELASGITILPKSTRSTFLYTLASSLEFKSLYQLSAKNNVEFLSLMYSKILQRVGNQEQADPTAFQMLLNQLKNGASRDEVAKNFFSTPEIKQAFINSLDLYDISSIPLTPPTPTSHVAVTPTPTSRTTVTPTPTSQVQKMQTNGKIIKGGVFCGDASLPVGTAQTRPILNAELLLVQDTTEEQKRVTTDQNGIFSFTTNLDTPFSIYVINLGNATERGNPIGGSVNPYVVANAEARLAVCQMEGMAFVGCQLHALPAVSDGFAFVVRSCAQ